MFELPNRGRLLVAPHATLRVFTVPQALALTSGARTWTWSLALQSGRVDVELPATGRCAVLANLGKLSGIITSGHAAFRVEGNEATAVNLGGELRTVLADHWQTVPEGSLATLSPEEPNAAVKPGIGSPTLEGGQRMWFSPNETVAMHGFRWGNVAGAERYDLRVRRLSDGKLIDQVSTTRTDWQPPLTPVTPGQYGLTLRAVDARGLEGRWSTEAALRVIGVVLPPGGYSDQQAIFLGVGQQVRFTNTEGLEMTYVGAGKYFPAAQAVKLYRGQKTVIGFRMPGAFETAVAELEPRGIFADVRIGPQRALWPRDPISIDVRLRATAGRNIPAFVQMIPTVTLGTEPVDLTFERTGDTLHAMLPPSDTPGPWVVRVDVADQYGVALGHDFLEVAAEGRRAIEQRGRRSAHPLPPVETPERRPAPEPPLAASN